MATPVEIVGYDSDWPTQYDAIATQLREQLGSSVASIDHIGSTSIPGMPAKPMIDIDVTLRSPSDIPTARSLLTSIGYESRGNRYDDDVWAFLWKSVGLGRRVYLCPPDNETHGRRIAFRNALRGDQSIAMQYAQLKYRLSAEFANDGDGYTAAKSNFITMVLERSAAPCRPARLPTV